MVGLGPGGEHSSTAHLTEDLLPRAIVHSAVANFKPLLPPLPPNETAPNRYHGADTLNILSQLFYSVWQLPAICYILTSFDDML